MDYAQSSPSIARASFAEPLDGEISKLQEMIHIRWNELQALLDEFEQKTERMVNLRQNFSHMRGREQVPGPDRAPTF